MAIFFQPPDALKKNIVLTQEKDQAEGLPNKAILCRHCLNEITSENFYTEKNNSHVHSFANPYGYIFTIRCFSSAPGIIATGSYSDEFSWFKEYSWKISLCRKCMTHLGWKFSGKESSFYGLIQDKIV